MYNETNSTSDISTDTECKNITNSDKALDLNKIDNKNLLESSVPIKCEEEDKNADFAEVLENAGNNDLDDLSSALVVETKIEIDEFSEDIKSVELENTRYYYFFVFYL